MPGEFALTQQQLIEELDRLRRKVDELKEGSGREESGEEPRDPLFDLHFPAAIVHSSSNAIIGTTPDGEIGSWNASAERMFGHGASEVVGRNASLLFPDNRRTEFDRILADLRSGRKVEGLQTQWLRKDGSPVDVDLTVIPVKDGRGKVLGMASIAVDISRERRSIVALQESEARLRAISSAVGEYIWETDDQWRFTFVTDKVEELLGHSSWDLLGRTPFEFMPGDEAGRVRGLLAEAMAQGAGFTRMELRVLHKDGRATWQSMSGLPVKDEAGRVRGFRGSGRDITGRKRAEHALRESEEKLRAMSRASLDAMVMIDAQDRIIFWNPAAERLFGYTEEEAAGRFLHELTTPRRDHAAARKGLEAFAATGRGPVVNSVMEMTSRRRDGSEFPVERSVAAFNVDGAWYAVGIVRDITKRKRDEARLVELATTDGLTGLLNRRHFLDLAGREVDRSRRYGHPLSLVMLDLDRFKSVNDTYGHPVGDAVLRAMAGVAGEGLRTSDLFGRLGGEEFAVLCPETDLEGALDVAERIRSACELARVPLDKGELRFSLSLGVALLDPAADDLDGLLKKADQALYAAKQGGRNRVVSA